MPPPTQEDVNRFYAETDAPMRRAAWAGLAGIPLLAALYTPTFAHKNYVNSFENMRRDIGRFKNLAVLGFKVAAVSISYAVFTRNPYFN